MNYNSVEELKKIINENPVPNNFVSLSDGEKEKYYDIFRNILFSYRFNGPISYLEFSQLLNSSYGVIFESEEQDSFNRMISIFAEWSVKLQEDIINALNDGYPVNDDLCQIVNSVIPLEEVDGRKYKYDEIYKLIIKQNVKMLKHYAGNNPSYYGMMLDNGYSFSDVLTKIGKNMLYDKISIITYMFEIALDKNIPFEEIMNCFNKLVHSEKIKVAILLLKKDLNGMINYFTKDNYLINSILVELIKNNDFDNEIFNKLFNIRKYSSRLYINNEILKLGIKDINQLNKLLEKEIISTTAYEKIFEDIVINDVNFFKEYRGNVFTKKICEFMTSDNYEIDIASIENLNDLFKYKKINQNIYSMILKKIISKNFDYIKYYIGYDFEIYRISLQNGTNVSRNLLIDVLLHNNDLSDDDLNIIFNILDIKPFDYHAIKAYKGNKYKLFESFNIIDYFLGLLNIDRDLFIQYAFASSYNWLDSMINIINNGLLDEFVQVKDFFFEKYYDQTNKMPGVVLVKNLIDMIKNFSNYPELCINIANGAITIDDIDNLKLLFDNSNIMKNSEGKVFNQISDLKNIDNVIFMNYQLEIKQAIDSNNIDKIKEILCLILFNVSESVVIQRLETYGNIKDFRQLLFDNRNNREIANYILEIMVYVSMMEDIIDCTNMDSLKNMSTKIMNNIDIYKMCQKCNILFKNFEEKVNSLYAQEMNTNLTDLSNVPFELYDQDFTNKYGIDCIDLRDRKYCLLEHVKSKNESIESLINGKTNGKQLFISLSLGSNRNQRLYCNGKSIIFACSMLPPELFIKSSVSNMGSNGYIKEYSYEINAEKITSKERGALETSSALAETNSEILCYREGLKFDYIILPNGREPTDEEVEIAKKYHLKFVKVQALSTTIENPKNIHDISQEENNHQIGDKSLLNSSLLSLQKFLHNERKKTPRKVAIYTDSHGLFEPTLAILEDARRSGITEIYSLGDNIGTGPNPKEVMDLMEIYGVKSLRGNHEMYASGELGELYKHLVNTGALAEATRNGAWTQSKLTKKQVDKIKSLPQDLVLNIGGKKVLLSHFINDYNTGERRNIPSDIDDIFQGHVHFESNTDNIHTIRGAGIGHRNNPGTARYIILTEKPDNGYDVEIRTVNFNPKMTQYDIIESDMADVDKRKISGWVGGKSK